MIRRLSTWIDGLSPIGGFLFATCIGGPIAYGALMLLMLPHLIFD